MSAGDVPTFTVWVASVTPSMTVTVLSVPLEAYAWLATELNAMAPNPWPTVAVWVASVTPSIWVTVPMVCELSPLISQFKVLPHEFCTQILFVTESTNTIPGTSQTVTVAVTLLLAPSTTLTVPGAGVALQPNWLPQ